MLLGFVFVVMGITLYQERKTERALEALRDLSSPRARVIRDSKVKRIPGREVVRDDILVLSEGIRASRCRYLSCTNLSTDESLLTGESVPVRKVACGGTIPEIALPGGDDLPFVYSGTLVVQGQGIACVRATGSQTELGKIGKALQTVDIEETPLQGKRHVSFGIWHLLESFLCPGHNRIWINQRRLAQWVSCRYYAGHGYPS